MNIDELVKAGNFAQIMRECFALLEKRHAGVSGMAYQQTVILRAYLQSLYDAQPKTLSKIFADNPETIHLRQISIAALAGHAYKLLEEGGTIDDIRAVPVFKFKQAARGIEQMFEPCNEDYTTLPILDTSKDVPSADTEPVQQGGYVTRGGLAHLADPCTSYLPREIADQYKRESKDPNSPTVNITMTVGTAWTEEEKAEWAQRMSEYTGHPKGYARSVQLPFPLDDLPAISAEKINAIAVTPRTSDKLRLIREAIDALSPNDPNKEKMQQIVRDWEQRHGLKGSDDV